MSSEAAKVIIDAEDLASKKIADAARNVERSVKNIKDVGGKAKASTEFIGTLANTLGGSQLSGYAGQLAQLTERISAFSEVSKAGGAGALAFKAGLVGVAATISFQVGKAIGDVVFQTAKWTKELELATEQAKKLSAEVERAAGTRFSGEMNQISMIEDPAEARKKTEELLAQIDKDIDAKNGQIAAYRKEVSSVDDTWSGFFSKVSGDVRAINEQNKEQVKEAERLKEIYKEQALELRKKLVADEEALKVAQKKKAEEEAIARQKEAEKKNAEEVKRLMDEAAKAEAARVSEMERIENIKKRETDRLKEQKILVEQGAEAAKRFNLENQGVDSASAARIAAEQAKLEEMQRLASTPDSMAIGSQAVQSRLLTRGPAEKGIDKIAKTGEKQLTLTQELIQAVKDKSKSPQFEVVT